MPLFLGDQIIADNYGVYYIEGQGTTDIINEVATWTGTHDDIKEYYSGLIIAYKISTAGSTTTTLNINNLGAVPVVKNATTAISTAHPVNSIVFLTYTVDSNGTAYWKVGDSNAEMTTGSTNKVDTKLYLVGASSRSSSATTYSNEGVYVGTDNCLYSNNKKVATTQDIEELVGNIDVILNEINGEVI